MTAFAIRLLALVTMLIDHLGYRLFPNIGWLRCVGRLSFPLFCFLIAEGFYHTRNRGKYALRLLLLAVVSEIPYNLFLRNRLWYFGGQNVFWTLLLGLLAAWWVWSLREDKLWFLRRKEEGEAKADPGMVALQLILLFIGVAMAGDLAFLFNTDYAFYGVALIIMFTLLRDQKIGRIIAFLTLVAAYVWYSLLMGRGSWSYTQFYGALAAIPIFLYNGKPGPRNKALQWGFYFFYPVHILVLWAIWQYL